jgi:calcium binding protein 39
MWQLKDDRRMVQYEAFHVFKVSQNSRSSHRYLAQTNHSAQIFAANPNKSPEVQKFLIMNKQRLLKFLPRFLEDRTDDDQFNDEKAWLVKAIGNLPDAASGTRLPGSTDGTTQHPTQVGL